MPVRRLYRIDDKVPAAMGGNMVARLEDILRNLTKTLGRKPRFCVFVTAAYGILNPDHLESLRVNFSQLEAIAAYVERFLLIENRRGIFVPDRNITWFYDRIRRIKHNNDSRNTRIQLRVNRHDFTETKKRTKTNPDGEQSTVSYRFLEIVRGNDSVNRCQYDLDVTEAGIVQTRDQLNECRNEKLVDIDVAEFLRVNGL